MLPDWQPHSKTCTPAALAHELTTRLCCNQEAALPPQLSSCRQAQQADGSPDLGLAYLASRMSHGHRPGQSPTQGCCSRHRTVLNKACDLDVTPMHCLQVDPSTCQTHQGLRLPSTDRSHWLQDPSQGSAGPTVLAAWTAIRSRHLHPYRSDQPTRGQICCPQLCCCKQGPQHGHNSPLKLRLHTAPVGSGSRACRDVCLRWDALPSPAH